ncbi:MAG: cadherin-like domain-containing protein [Chromatiales bacterium]|nr:cadherin-like domain-containing protein [Chromatiales bacterium]
MLGSKAKLPIAIALSTALLAACGGGGSSSSGGGASSGGGTPPATGSSVKGVAVKGPLVNAAVRAYAVDYAAADLIGTAGPVDTGTTNAQAQITGLTLDPAGAPYIVVVEADEDTVDLTTGAPPVITIMKTVITAEMLNGGTPVVATPLTSLATEVAASKGATPETLQQNLTDAQNTVKSTLGFGLDESVDIFSATPVLNDDTDTPEEQAQVAAYRLAVEAVSAVLSNAADDSTEDGDSATDVLSSMALDLSDGVIDGKKGDDDLLELAGVDVTSVAVANLMIPGTSTPVGNITQVLDSEAQSLGTSVTVDQSVTVEPEEVVTVADTDFDGVADDVDNCINTKNADQLDANDNEVGAACEAVPQIAAVSGSGEEDGGSISIDLSGSEPDGDTLTFTVNGQPLPPGQSTYSFTPEPNFFGQVELPYSVSDGEKSSVESTITIDVTPVNDPVSGSLTVAGAAEEGVTLSLNNQMADDDGELTILSYQWLANGQPIDGATSETFVPQQAQVGAMINVEVVFSDGVFPEVTVPSAPVGPIANTINNATGGSVEILGDLIEGETLTTTNNLVDPDGTVEITGYQWLADGQAIDGATQSSLLLGQAQVGTAVSVVLTYTDGTFAGQMVTTAATLPVANVDNGSEGSVTITGTVEEDQTLQAVPEFTDEDGLENVEYLYQWFADGQLLDGETSDQLLLDDNHVDKAITVQVTFSDDLGGSGGDTSDPTIAVVNVNDTVQGSVIIAGQAMDTQQLSVSNFLAGLSDDDGLPGAPPAETTYQWKRAGGDIDGANAATYTLVTADVGNAITVEISFPDSRGTTETVTSEPTAAVAQFNNLPTGSVTISGDTQNQTWTASNDLADADGPDPLVISYQWYADGGVIVDETNSTFTPGQEYVGASIFVRASYTDGDDNLTDVDSASVVVIDADDASTGGVAITGVPTEDEFLTATNDLSDPDGEIVIEGYQWLANGSPIDGATVGEYQLTQAEVGQNISVEVTFNDGVFGNQVLLSSQTALVNNVNDLPQGEVTISGVPAPGNTLSASNNLTDEDGMGAVSYEWFVDAVSDGFGATYDVQQADVGQEVYVIASYYDGQETLESVNSASVMIDGSAPAAAFNPASFSGQIVYDVFDEDGDEGECAGTKTFVRMDFASNGNFDATSACDDEMISGTWAFEQNNEVLVLNSPEFDQTNYVVASAGVVDNKQASCWIDDEDVMDSATALDICRNGESSVFYSLVEWVGSDAFYFDLADVHADTFDTKRFSHTWLAGRTLFDVWHGGVDSNGDCDSEPGSAAGLSRLEFSEDGTLVDIYGIAGDLCNEPGVELSINEYGQLGDSTSGAGINFLGNTDQYLEVVFRNEDGSPDNVDRFFHSQTDAQAAFDVLTDTYMQSFNEAQVLKSAIYNVYSDNDDWIIEKIKVIDAGTVELSERASDQPFFSDSYYAPETLLFYMTETSLTFGADEITWHLAEDPKIGAGHMANQGNGFEVCWDGCDDVETFFFNEEAAQQFADSMQLASEGNPLIGSWLIDEGMNQRNILTFIDNTHYVVFHEYENTDQPAGSAEYGTYSWDQESGAFTASAIAQSDGEGGLEGSSFTLLVNGDAFTTDDGFGADRIVDEAQPIVGSWVMGEGDDLNILTFLSATEYAIVHTENQGCYGEPCSPQALSGEFGFYSWDGYNFEATSVSVDTNGDGGLFNAENPEDQQGEAIQIVGNVLTFTDAGEGDYTFNRVGSQSQSLACGYESGWDDMNDKPLVFNSLNDYGNVIADCDMKNGPLPSFSTASLAGKTLYVGEGEMIFNLNGDGATGLDYGDDEIKGTFDDEAFFVVVSDFATNQVLLEYSVVEGGLIEGYDMLTLLYSDGNEYQFTAFYESYGWAESDQGYIDTSLQDGEIWNWTWYETDPNGQTLGCYYDSGWDDLNDKPETFNSVTDYYQVRSACADIHGAQSLSVQSLAGLTFYEEGNEAMMSVDGSGNATIIEPGENGVFEGGTGDDEVFSVTFTDFDTNVIKLTFVDGQEVVSELWSLVYYSADELGDGKDFWEFRLYSEESAWDESDGVVSIGDEAKEGEIWSDLWSTASDFNWAAIQ